MRFRPISTTCLALGCVLGGVSMTDPTDAALAADAATTPAPRNDGWWMTMHSKFLERAKAGEVDLLFLGDSITQGWNENPIWKRHYAPRNAANFGIGGDQTQHVLWRIQNGELEGISPKVAVLMIGTNNIGSNTPEEIADGVKAIVIALREKLPKTKVLLLGIFPRDPKPESPNRQRVEKVNEIIDALGDGKSVVYLDIGEKFLQPDKTLSRDVMPDYVHLSRQGYRIWADAIEPTLWTMMEGN